MKRRLTICTLIILSIYISSGCNYNPVAPDSGSDMCWRFGTDGQIHYYMCHSSGSGGGGHINNDYTARITVILPDTAFNKPYGVFFISDTLTYEAIHEEHGLCTNDTIFRVYCGNVPADSFYLAVLVAPDQQYPIKFEPKTGDYLGWYKGKGIYPGVKHIHEAYQYYSVYLEKIP